MDVQSLQMQTLTTRFISSSLLPNGFDLKPTSTQVKFCFPSKSLLSDRLQTAQWVTGFCKTMCLGKDRALELTASPFSVRRPRFKSSGRQGTCFVTGNGDSSTPEDRPDEENQSESIGPSQNVDWRAFRAKLVAAEQVGKSENDDSERKPESKSAPISLAPKWAHPIHEPESGCVLVATEKLDGTQSFERTVILMLRVDSEGPFGIILNRPLPRSIAERKPTHPDMATIFDDCPLHFGGPLEASMFLLMAEDKYAVGDAFEEVIPGMYFGDRDSLHHAAELVRSRALQSENFGFFYGYCGWESDQLRAEIAMEYWYVAACSPNLMASVASASSSGLWEEVLQLMGDQYAELSRKPKQDSV